MSQHIPADAPGDFYVLKSACSICGFTLSGVTALTWFDPDGVRYLPEELR